MKSLPSIKELAISRQAWWERMHPDDKGVERGSRNLVLDIAEELADAHNYLRYEMEKCHELRRFVLLEVALNNIESSYRSIAIYYEMTREWRKYVKHPETFEENPPRDRKGWPQ